MRDGLRVLAIPGRGNGLVATRDFAAGERLIVATAFGFAKYEPQGRQCCAHCLRFGEGLLRCACGTCYCSAACQHEDASLGHGFCCAALKSIAAIPRVKNSEAADHVRSSAEFLLRAFAARRAAAAAAAAAAPGAISPTRDFGFDSAMGQCRDEPHTMLGYAKREETREQAVALASLHAGQLMRKRHGDAMSLLRSEPCNSVCRVAPALVFRCALIAAPYTAPRFSRPAFGCHVSRPSRDSTTCATTAATLVGG
jgi:hypothetical protein